MVVAVSACLLGENCKYDGGNNYHKKVAAFLEGHTIIPICPETLGGLPTPRNPAEIVNGVVRTKNGTSVNDAFQRGAEKAMGIIKDKEVELVILQSRSPSCGVREVYDGSFTGKLIMGAGIFAQMAKDAGVEIKDVAEV